MEESSEKNQLVTAWQTAVKRGTDFDLWGQPVEAIESYNRLASHLRIESSVESTLFNDHEKKMLNKVAACLELRCRGLQTPGKIEGVTVEDMRKIGKCLKNIQSVNSRDFPVDLSKLQSLSGSKPSGPPLSSRRLSSNDIDEDSEDPLEQKLKGNLLPPSIPVPGETQLSIRIEKIGLKDASQYLDSYITISIKDTQGFDLVRKQDTPIASLKEDMYIFFGVDVHIQKMLESLPNGFAIFFEFKHYKPKKKSISTKCWSFIEKEEVKEGSSVVELYQKPPDYKRKKIKLLTVKPLYLHIKVSLN